MLKYFKALSVCQNSYRTQKCVSCWTAWDPQPRILIFDGNILWFRVDVFLRSSPREFVFSGDLSEAFPQQHGISWGKS